MKEILRRTLIVFWLVGLAGSVSVLALVGAGIFVSGIVGPGIFVSGWEFVAVIGGAVFLLLPVWALQFVVTGLVNPLGLLRRTPQ